jgi:biotin carboxylase
VYAFYDTDVSRIVLVLPTASYRAADFIEAARRVGTKVVVAAEHRLAGLAGLSADSSLVISLKNPQRAAEAIAGFASRHSVDAVVAVDDEGVYVASLAQARLGLPHNPQEAIAATRDKQDMRLLLERANVLQPDYRLVRPHERACDVVSDIGFPCVIKPVSLSASRGVIRADDTEQAHTALERARQIARTGSSAQQPLLLERYIPGAEVAVEGLLRGGKLEVLAVFDKPDSPEGPYFEETLLVTPSRLPTPALSDIRKTTAAAVSALGLQEGPVHAELRVSDGRSYVLEVAARSIGGLCSRSLRFGLGARLEEIILRHALSLPLDNLEREPAASGVMMIPIQREGILRGVLGLDAANAVPGVAGIEISATQGRTIRPLPEGDRYLGFIFARGLTPAEVEVSLRRAYGLLEIRIDQPELADRAQLG